MWLLLITSLIIFLIIVVLLIPLQIRFSYQLEERFSLKLRVSWLFGLLKIEFPPKKKKIKPKKPPKVKAKKKVKRKFSIKPILALLKNKKFIHHGICYLKRAHRSIHFHAGKFYLRLGFNDPADTGKVSGLFIPVFLFLQNTTPLDLQYEPDFAQTVLASEGESTLNVNLLKLMFASILFIFSLQTFKIVLAVKKARFA